MILIRPIIVRMRWNDLRVWKKAHSVVLSIYKITDTFPRRETYGIISQLRRASSSIAVNIVEGQARKSTKEYLQFLYHSRGSLEETRYFLVLSKDLDYISADKYEELTQQCEDISKMLNGLIKSLKAI